MSVAAAVAPLTRENLDSLISNLPQPISTIKFSSRPHFDRRFSDRESNADDNLDSTVASDPSPTVTRSGSTDSASSVDTLFTEPEEYDTKTSTLDHNATEFLLGKAPVRYESSDDEDAMAAFQKRIALRGKVAAEPSIDYDSDIDFNIEDDHFDEIEKFAAANRSRHQWDSWDEMRNNLRDMDDDLPVVWTLKRGEPFTPSPRQSLVVEDEIQPERRYFKADERLYEPWCKPFLWYLCSLPMYY